jgi:hypothetical protein
LVKLVTDQARQIKNLKQQLTVARQKAHPVPPAIQQNIIARTVVQVQKPIVIANCAINAWNGKDRLVVSLDLLRSAFRESAMLREYCESPERNRLDPKYIAGYVLEALMAVIRQAHCAPGSRNIRLNPSRADQVQVLVREGSERWEILSLTEAVNLLFRDAAGRMTHLARSADARRDLAPAEQIASLLMPQEYHRQPDKYVREGKGRMAAHLASLDAKAAASPIEQDAVSSHKRGPTELGGAALQTGPVAPEFDQTALEALLADLAADAQSRPQRTARLPSRPPPFSPAAAAALLHAHPPTLDAEGRAPPSALRRLEAASGQDPARIINHLWDAKEEGRLSTQEQLWVAALTRLHDGAS